MSAADQPAAPAGPPPSPVPPDSEDEGGRGALGVVAYLAFIVIGSLLVFGFSAALGPAIASQGESACRGLRPDKREGEAPSFAVQDLAGNEVTLESLRGKFVVLNFWATWCEPCTREWPQLSLLAERLIGRDDIVVLAVSVDEDRTAIAPYLERMSLTDTGVRVVWDPTQKLHLAYGTTKLPDTYFVDERGQLVHVYVNARDWGRPAAVRCVESMLGR